MKSLRFAAQETGLMDCIETVFFHGQIKDIIE